jgi:hypothetical protein
MLIDFHQGADCMFCLSEYLAAAPIGGDATLILKVIGMKKLAALTSVFSLAAPATFAQNLNPEDIMVATQSAPGGDLLVPALLALLVIAAMTASSSITPGPV